MADDETLALSFLSDGRQAILGGGWSFPVRVNLQGGLARSDTARNIEESIWLILGTQVGERPGLPEFGSYLGDLAFAPMDTDTLVQICVAVEDALSLWEPRIILENVQAEADPTQGVVNVVIDYRPEETYNLSSLVYPFYLQPPEVMVDPTEVNDLTPTATALGGELDPTADYQPWFGRALGPES